MTDELTGAEPKIISASFADPYILVVRDDSSILLLEADESGDLDEVERGEAILATQWLSGSLYKDSKHSFRVLRKDETETNQTDIFLFLLSGPGSLQVSLPSRA